MHEAIEHVLSWHQELALSQPSQAILALLAYRACRRFEGDILGIKRAPAHNLVYSYRSPRNGISFSTRSVTALSTSRESPVPQMLRKSSYSQASPPADWPRYPFERCSLPLGPLTPRLYHSQTRPKCSLMGIRPTTMGTALKGRTQSSLITGMGTCASIGANSTAGVVTDDFDWLFHSGSGHRRPLTRVTTQSGASR